MMSSKRPLDNTSSSSEMAPKKLQKTASGSPTWIKFFVRTFSTNRPTLFFRENADERISSVLEKVKSLIGIPLDGHHHLRLIYRGKQLESEKTLHESKIEENDSVLQLVGRLESSSNLVWDTVQDIMDLAVSIYNSQDHMSAIPAVYGKALKDSVERLLLSGTWLIHKLPEYLNTFSSWSGPQALVKLYACDNDVITLYSTVCIHYLVTKLVQIQVPEDLRYQCLPILLEFCNLLREAKGVNDLLYQECRSCARHVLMALPKVWENKGFVIDHFIPFVVESAVEISRHLGEDVGTTLSAYVDFSRHVSEFCEFTKPVRKILKLYVKLQGRRFNTEFCTWSLPQELEKGIADLHKVFVHLLSTLERKMSNVVVEDCFGFRYYLMILRELYSISKLYYGCEKLFREAMILRKRAFCNLIIGYGNITIADWKWILKLKEVTRFQIRRDLALRLLPKLEDGREKEMLIDRSHLLSMSFDYIGNSNPESLRPGLSIQFQDEEAMGFGVLREWFVLVCQAIFNPEYGLFAACPNDRRRFFPSTESEQDRLHLQYFRFSGRLIALALMHEVQVGVALDRVFFLQLAGQDISLDDIQDADPVLYSSCRKILEMDPASLDQDELALTFSHEIERFGARKVVELCPGGSSIVVNSKNRKQYVDSLIHQLFVTAISEQVAHFSQGFVDIVRYDIVKEKFFRGLFLKDFDLMLHGDESEIRVKDWRAHTDYRGFEASDHHISWFWKIVRGMSKEQKRTLLYFWTSIKYLPYEGFSGLTSRLSLVKTSESLHHLPSSHTCFYQLCFPSYGSFTIMRDRFHMITKEHISCSFGTE